MSHPHPPTLPLCHLPTLIVQKQAYKFTHEFQRHFFRHLFLSSFAVVLQFRVPAILAKRCWLVLEATRRVSSCLLLYRNEGEHTRLWAVRYIVMCTGAEEIEADPLLETALYTMPDDPQHHTTCILRRLHCLPCSLHTSYSSRTGGGLSY